MEVWEVRVYKNFDDLIDHNKSLFKRILEDGHIDLMRACWSARDPEIRNFEKRILLKERESEKTIADLAKLKEEYQTLLGELESTTKKLEGVAIVSDNQTKAISELEQNCESLEKFNQELLEVQNNLQDDVANFEQLNELKEQEYLALKESYDREKLETKLELKNAKEAISYANELEDLQKNNLKYIDELETKLQKTAKDYESIKKSYISQAEIVKKHEQELDKINKNLQSTNAQKSGLEKKHQLLLAQYTDLESLTKKLKDQLYSANLSSKQKQTNLTQLQSTLDLKVKTLEEREKEAQQLANQLKSHEHALNELREEINLMDKVILESEENQRSLEDYAEKLKVTTEREIIKRKESDAKYEVLRSRMANLLTEKENLEAKFKAVEKTLSGIQQQLTPRASAIKTNHHLQLDN